MDYLIIFLEGIITFISPCMLPMLPVYLSYFAGQENDEKNTKKTIINIIGFIIGFTVIFTILGIFSASLGILLKRNIKVLNIVLGIIVIFFGLRYTGLINFSILNKSRGTRLKKYKLDFLSSILFGIIFSLTWTPCVGAFLGTALSLITITGNIVRGITLIITYCMGLGIPFLISALLIDKLKNTFDGIKKHYRLINIICGIFLCIIGIVIVTGLMNKYFTMII